MLLLVLANLWFGSLKIRQNSGSLKHTIYFLFGIEEQGKGTKSKGKEEKREKRKRRRKKYNRKEEEKKFKKQKKLRYHA